MSDISMGIERRLSSLRVNVDGALALCFTLAGLAASVASAALGI